MKVITTKIIQLVLASSVLIAPIKLEHEKPKKLTDVECMTANVFFEAGNQSINGKLAVASVTLNRTNSVKYPTSICSVVFDKKQFSWTHTVNLNKIHDVITGNIYSFNKKEQKAWKESREIAENLSKTLKINLPAGTLWYHADYVKPSWSYKLKQVSKIGNHIFYKE